MLSESSPITFNSSYPTYDGNGNGSEYLDSTGQITAHYEYDPFGNTIVNTDTANQFAYRFSTKPLAFATGLYYYGYRYYDPMTGRWPSRDPIEERGGLNLYGFVNNCGINFADKLGKKLLKVQTSDVTIESRSKPVPYYGSEGGKVTNAFQSQGGGSGPPLWCTIKLPGKLEISAWAYSDEDGALAHEEHHVKLTVEGWNTFVDEVNWAEKTFCKCGRETLIWIHTREHLRFLETHKKNLDFDKTDYTARGVSSKNMADLDREISTNNVELAAAKIADDAALKARTDCEKK